MSFKTICDSSDYFLVIVNFTIETNKARYSKLVFLIILNFTLKWVVFCLCFSPCDEKNLTPIRYIGLLRDTFLHFYFSKKKN